MDEPETCPSRRSSEYSSSWPTSFNEEISRLATALGKQPSQELPEHTGELGRDASSSLQAWGSGHVRQRDAGDVLLGVGEDDTGAQLKQTTERTARQTC